MIPLIQADDWDYSYSHKKWFFSPIWNILAKVTKVECLRFKPCGHCAVQSMFGFSTICARIAQ